MWRIVDYHSIHKSKLLINLTLNLNRIEWTWCTETDYGYDYPEGQGTTPHGLVRKWNPKSTVGMAKICCLVGEKHTHYCFVLVEFDFPFVLIFWSSVVEYLYASTLTTLSTLSAIFQQEHDASFLLCEPIKISKLTLINLINQLDPNSCFNNSHLNNFEFLLY